MDGHRFDTSRLFEILDSSLSRVLQLHFDNIEPSLFSCIRMKARVREKKKLAKASAPGALLCGLTKPDLCLARILYLSMLHSQLDQRYTVTHRTLISTIRN